MNGVRFRPDRRADNRLDVEIAAARLRRPDADRAVGEPCWHGVEVRLRSREHRLDAEVAASTDDADGDLAAVRDQDPPNGHVGGWRNRIRTCPASTSWPSEAQISATVPAAPALTEFISFMTSMMPTTVCSPTSAPMSTKGAAPGFGAR